MSQPKASKKDKTGINLRDVQTSVEQQVTNRGTARPVDIYNTMVRKEGEKVLTEGEYNAKFILNKYK